MFSPLTKTLKKIFAAGFYRIHGGGLIFLFVSVVSSCFYINTLGDIAPGDVAIKSLVITLTLVSNPIMMGMFILISLIYAIKSRQYIAVQLLKQENEFLYYSCTAITKLKQFKSWFWVQIIIFIPIFIYAIYSALIGFIFGHYLIPTCIFIYLFLLVVICASINLIQANDLIDINKQTLILKLTKKLNKPFFLLYFYYVVNKLKLTFFITKFSSVLLIVCTLIFFDGINKNNIVDLRMPYFVVLAIVTAHIMLIYQELKFNLQFLSFSYHFPYSILKLFVWFTLNYLLLMIPEIIWIFSFFKFNQAFILTVWALSLIHLFRSLLYAIGLKMKTFIKFIFILFFVFQFGIMYQLFWILLPLNFIIAFIVLHKNYWHKELTE